jgi:hypothetical protein
VTNSSLLKEMMRTPGGTMVRGLGARGPTPPISKHASRDDNGVEAMVSSFTSFNWAMEREKMNETG